jgi:O-acetyl-ADP-ribose deacetylase (regulator of RNase III)
MSVKYVQGNLLDADLEYYCHQVNCQGRMGSGIAKAIKEKWPVVYDAYVDLCQEREDEIYHMCGSMENGLDWTETLLGEVQLIRVEEGKTVINLFGQHYYGYDGKRYTSYDAFWACLGKIRETVPVGSKIGFPDHIGCGLGGANWEVMKTMICEVLSEDFDVYIYKLEV